MTNIEQLNQWSELEAPSPAQQAAEQRVEVYYRQIQRGFSRAFLDGLLDAENLVQEIRSAEDFARGFRLGVGLIIEGLHP